MRSNLCQLSKQHVANALEGVDGSSLETPGDRLKTPLIVPAGFGHAKF